MAASLPTLPLPLALAFASRWVDPKLVFIEEHPAAPTPHHAAVGIGATAGVVFASGRWDRHVADDAAAQSAAVPSAVALERLASTTLVIERGLLRRRAHTVTRELLQRLDVEVLAAVILATQETHPRADDHHLNWLAMPPSVSAGMILQEQPSVIDPHVHLAGMLPASAYWVTLMSQEGTLDGVLPASWPDLGTWAARIAVARQRMAELLRHEAEPDANWDPDWRRTAWRAFERNGLPLVERTLGPWPPLDPRRGPYLMAMCLDRALLVRATARYFTAYRSHPLVSAYEEYVGIRNAFHWRLTANARFGRGLRHMVGALHQRRFSFGPGEPTTLATLEARRMEWALESFLKAHGHACDPLVHAPQRLELELRVPLVQADHFVPTLQGWLVGVRASMRRHGAHGLGLGLIVELSRSSHLEAEERLRPLLDYLADNPEVAQLFVGIDAVGDELDAEPRDFVDAYSMVRGFQPRGRPKHDAPLLRLAYHAGEDFRDLLTGLRRIGEAVRLLDLGPNDRLGHGLALSWPTAHFYDRRPESYPRVGEHVLDLVWAWQAVCDPSVGTEGQMRHRHTIEAHLRAVLGPRVDAAHCAQLSRVAHSPSGRPKTMALLAALGLDMARASESWPLAIDGEWRSLVDDLQRVVHAWVAKQNVVVEINPTSNLLVGGFASYAELPYLRLNSLGIDFPRDRPNLRIVCGSDDPGLIATTLIEEFANLERGLIDGGVDPACAASWVERVRAAGFRYSLIPANAPRGDALHGLLNRVLDP